MRCCFRWMWAGSLAILGTITQPSRAQNFTWTAASLSPSDWNNPGNWSPNSLPMGPSQFAVFTGLTPSFLPSISSGSVSLGGLIFQGLSSSQNYAITSGNANTMTLTGSTSIFVDSTVSSSSLQILSLNNTAGALLVPGGTPLTIINNAAVSTDPTFSIGINTGLNEVSGTSALIVSGTGHTRITGPSDLDGGFIKRGSGRLTLAGNWTNASGGSRLAGGTLTLDYASAPTFRLPAGTLNLDGGRLVLTNGASGNSFAETTGSPTALNPGHTFISANASSGTLSINLNGITSNGGTLDVETTGGGFVSTSTALVNNIVGGFATTGNGMSWASKSGANIVPLATYVLNGYGPTANTDVDNGNGGTNLTTNSLRFNTGQPSGTFAWSGSLTLNSGGILVTPNMQSQIVMSGSSLVTPGVTPLFVHQNSTSFLGFSHGLTISSAINSAGGLIKSGPSELTLTASSPNLTGPIHINRGDLTITTALAVNSSSGLFFNDKIGDRNQVFTVEMISGIGTTVNRPIQLSLDSGIYRTIFSTGSSQNARLALSGVISSNPGAKTDLILTGTYDSSGVNLTGANTFSGTVRLQSGFLGVNSGQSLGGSSNILDLAVGSSVSGGLEFLNNAIVDQPVNLSFFSRVIVNGSNMGTLAGTLSGSSALYKDGTGTLLLTGSNTHTGGIVVTNGRLMFSSDANLGAVTNDVTLNSETSLELAFGTSTMGTGRSVFLGPTSGNGTGTVVVPNGASLTIDGVVANRTGGVGGLEKTGAGTLNLNGVNTYSGGTHIRQGTLQVNSNSALGTSGSVTVDTLGTLSMTSSTTTSRFFELNGGLMTVGANAILTMQSATIGGGFVAGPGTYATQAGFTSSVYGATLTPSANFQLNGPALFQTTTNYGRITVASGTTSSFNYFINASSGQMTVNGTANVREFVSNGLLTVPAGGLVNNTGSPSPIVLGGGSTTFVGSVANPGGKIDLGGQQLIVRGGLLVTNAGTFGSGNGVRNGQTVADYGALVKGTGPYQSVITQNGGQYLPGNSPGTSQVGDFFINPGGNLIFQITDAGPSASFPSALGTAGNNPGWGLTQIFTSMNFTATPATPFTITMQTQLPPPAAPDTPGAMSSFDPNRSYQWLIFDLQPGAAFTGTFDPAAINFATAQFVNATAGGTFSLARTGGQIFLTFTPVPEPVHILALAVSGIAVGGAIRRRRRKS